MALPAAVVSDFVLVEGRLELRLMMQVPVDQGVARPEPVPRPRLNAVPGQGFPLGLAGAASPERKSVQRVDGFEGNARQYERRDPA